MGARRTRRCAWFGAAWLGAVALVGAPSCSAPGKGALILAISTDMQTPKDVSVVSVYVETNGVPKLDLLGRVSPDGSVDMPGTLAIVEPDDPSAEVRIRVIAFQEQKARVMRDVLTTVPHQRTAFLRIPLNFLDDGSVSGTLSLQDLPAGPGHMNGPPEALSGTSGTSFNPADTNPSAPEYMKSACDFTQGQTSVAGSCADAHVDSSSLPDYADVEVFGEGGTPQNPSCFDVQGCFGKGAPIAPSTITTAADGSCSFPIAPTAKGHDWNCALATTDGTGDCFGGRCFVPLESDPGEGFAIQPGQAVVMVPGVCKKLKAGATLYVDKSSCATKLESSPVCEGTSGPSPDGGAPSRCDGTYAVSCGAGTCAGDAGCAADACAGRGSAVIAVQGTSATVSDPALGSMPVAGMVDVATCTVTIQASTVCGGAAAPWSFDLSTGAVSVPGPYTSATSPDGGMTCSTPGTCTYGTCTVTMGAASGGDGGGPADASIEAPASGDGSPADASPADAGPSGDACPSGQKACAGGCTDTNTDPQNCGMCGHSCAFGDAAGQCVNGVCG